VSTGFNDNLGVNIKTNGDESDGVYVWTNGDESDGVFAYSQGAGSDALYGFANGAYSVGVRAYSGQSDAIYASAFNPSSYGLNTPNKIRANGVDLPTADVAEYMPVTEDVAPGTVLVIGEDGKLQPSTTAYDTRVAGIVSTEPGVSLGTKEGGNPGEEIIAVAGRVPCKVDATHTPIHAGDLLTTSDNPGYAMKAVPDVINGHKYYPDGTILGKAMGSLDSGTGTIEVLVTLQ
jgi:hypothetical protein